MSDIKADPVGLYERIPVTTHYMFRFYTPHGSILFHLIMHRRVKGYEGLTGERL